MDAGRLRLPLAALMAIFVVDAAVLYLAQTTSLDGGWFIAGTVMGVVAAIFGGSTKFGRHWVGELVALLFVCGFYVWIGQRLLGRTSRPYFNGFDGSNVEALLPGLLALIGVAAAFIVYTAVNRPRTS
jgi:hypothetical protein